MVNPVSVSDLAERWRPLSDDETRQAYAKLDDAWAVLQAQLPGIADRIADASLNVDLVKMVVSAMVQRVLSNPEGFRQGSRTVDDFTESWTRDASVATGSLYATAAELAILRPASARRHNRDTRLVRVPPYGGREPSWLRPWDAW